MNTEYKGRLRHAPIVDDTFERDNAARRTINALEMSSNLISALVRNPGPLGERESIVDAAKTMLRSSDSATQKLIIELGLKDVPSSHFGVMRAVSRAVSDKWRSTSNQSRPSADVSDLLEVWVEIAKAEIPLREASDGIVDHDVFHTISLLDSMLPVIREISVFDLFHDQRQAAVHSRSQIIAAVDVALDMLSIGATKSDSKMQLKAALLRNAGSIYASAWRRQADELNVELSMMDAEDKMHSIDSFKHGYPLKKIDGAFLSSFQRLVELVQFLAPQTRTLPAAGN